MNDLISKISSYNIFNYLFPGAIFIAACRYLEIASVPETNILIDAFVAYFLGMTISRIGSVLVEPIAKKSGFVHYANYHDYLSAAAEDPKLETLVEQNNVYRTLVALLVLLPITLAAKWLLLGGYISVSVLSMAVFLSLFCLYALAYRKQTFYIKSKVMKVNEK